LGQEKREQKHLCKRKVDWLLRWVDVKISKIKNQGFFKIKNVGMNVQEKLNEREREMPQYTPRFIPDRGIR
jgi:hypothetical protein